jgi:outer membrane protein assembly factor BamB
MRHFTSDRRAFGCLALALWLAAGIVETMAAEQSASQASAANAWPVFRGDPQADGIAAGSLPAQPVVLWKKSIKDAMFEATPAIGDGMVYIGGLDGYFRALDLATGDERWQFHSELGFKAPAAVRDGMVFAADGDGSAFGLDARTGKQVWVLHTDAEINAGPNFYHSSVLIGSQDGTLYALDSQTGKEHWKYSIDNMIQCSPTVIGDRAFIAGCDGKLHVLELAPGAKPEDPTKLVDSRTIDIHDPTGATPAAAGSLVWFGTQGNRFLCIDWQAGKQLWEFEPRRKQPFQSSAALGPAVVVVGGRDRNVHALDRATGKVVWQVATKSKVDCSPVIVGERIFVGTGDGRLMALALASGEKLWEYEAGGGFTGSPAVADGRLVIANDDGELFCFGAK